MYVVAIRGNVDTRIARMQDGLVLARAGLIRLGRAHAIVSTFDVDEMVPAAGQGIVALEALRTSSLGREAAAAINHPRSALAARCERGVLQQFGTILDCTSCVAVRCSEKDRRPHRWSSSAWPFRGASTRTRSSATLRKP